MGGAPPLPLGFAPQGAKKGTFLHFSAPEDQPGGFEGTQANRLPRAGHLRSLPPDGPGGSPDIRRGNRAAGPGLAGRLDPNRNVGD